ncbi:ECF transporter S component [Candidatus Bathyarchaeota archaeon]|nr:ECF transporter S component [Candidatus Bathyarchaeota archaeon]
MSDILKDAPRSRVIASIAIFSALYMVLRLIPTFPVIGVAGSFALSDIIAPLFGIILGPYAGGLSVILGTFLAMALGRPPVFMGLDFLPATVNAVALGLLIKRKWSYVILLNIALLAAFLLNPLTSVFVEITLGNVSFSFPFAWLHIVAFVVLVSPLGRKAADWIENFKASSVAWGLGILAFVGTMMQHLMGNVLFEVILNQLPLLLGQEPIIPTEAYSGIWTVIFFVYPVERMILVLLSVLIGVPLLLVLRKSFSRIKQ